MNDLGLAGLSVFGVLKFGFVLVFALYVVFAIVVVRQVNLMGETLKIGLDKILRVVSLLHFALEATIFLLALVVL